jgi:phosphopantetheine adenylyltransferase
MSVLQIHDFNTECGASMANKQLVYSIATCWLMKINEVAEKSPQQQLKVTQQ